MNVLVLSEDGTSQTPLSQDEILEMVHDEFGGIPTKKFQKGICNFVLKTVTQEIIDRADEKIWTVAEIKVKIKKLAEKYLR